MLYSKGNETREAYHSPECALLTHMQGRQTLPRFPWVEEICDCDQRPIFPVFCTNYCKPLVCHWGVRTVQSMMMTYPMLHTTMALSLNSSELRTHSSESQLISQTSCVMPKQVNDGFFSFLCSLLSLHCCFWLHQESQNLIHTFSVILCLRYSS